MKHQVVQLDSLAAVPCPCGQSRRAFADSAASPASVHVVEIRKDARPHYHRRLTEIYVVLEGTGHVEVDAERVPVRPLTAVLIPPGCRHRAVGNLRVLNVVVPRFDPADEWEDA